MEKFTVMGSNELTGSICCLHVLAEDNMNAFASAAALNIDFSFICAMPGWVTEGPSLAFPGEGIVLAETVLEQSDVFGVPAYRLDADEIENVLRQYSMRVANSKGNSFATMAVELLDDIDQEHLVRAVLKSEVSSSAQLQQAAFDEIKRVLVKLGVLEF